MPLCTEMCSKAFFQNSFWYKYFIASFLISLILKNWGKNKMGYDPKSSKASEFINHEEILETLEYAARNKDNKELIEGILDKANRAKGLTHREAAVLLECEDEELTQRMFRLAEDLKKRFYGNRIVMFAPLYLSNYCRSEEHTSELQSQR